MGYRVVDSDAVEPTPDRPCDRRALSEPAGLTQMALNRFIVEPGEQIPLAYHYHDDQEEAFYVLSGTLHIETPEKTYEVGPNHLFTVEPESPQRAFNPETAEETVDVIAVGAPPSDDDVHPYEPER